MGALCLDQRLSRGSDQGLIAAERINTHVVKVKRWYMGRCDCTVHVTTHSIDTLFSLRHYLPLYIVAQVDRAVPLTPPPDTPTE